MPDKHSGLGIASFVVSILDWLLSFVLMAVAVIMELATPGGMDETSPAAVVLGLSLFFLFFVAVVALGLGVGGLVQPDRKKVFPVLGTIFSALFLALAVLAMAVEPPMQ